MLNARQFLCVKGAEMATEGKQNITLRLSRQTLQKARVLAARRPTSISGLLAAQIEELVSAKDDYGRAMREALAPMEKGFDLGGTHTFDRALLRER